MAKIWRNPLRASLPPSFHTLFVPSRILFFFKPSHHNNNGLRSCAPKMLSSKRRSSEFDSGSTSSSSDFVILSTSESSDGSIVFRFGHAKDGETTVASADVVKADNAATEGSITEHGKQSDESMGTDSSLEQVKSHSKRRGRRQSAQVNREVSSVRDGDNNEQFHYRVEPDTAEDQVKSRTKRRGRRNSAKLTKKATSVLDRERGEEESVIDSTSELSESVEEAALDTKISDLSHSEVSIGEVSLDHAIDVVETRNTGSEVDVVPNEEIRNEIEKNSASIGENGVLDVADNFAPRASSEESSHAEVASLTTSSEDNGDLVGVTNASTMKQAETSLDQEIHTITSDADVESDKTGTAVALGYNVSSESSEEERASKTNRSNAAGVSISEVVEFHSIKETPSREETSTAGFVLSFGAASLPHPSKGFDRCRRFLFFASQSWLGVADGVGQWSLEGSSAALYARELMDNCERIVADFKGIQVKEPEEVLIRSVAEAQSPGSSTILVAHFDGQTFHVANIGDSGFIIVRNGAVFEKSSPMVHEFNFPVHIERGDDPSKLIEGYKIDLDEGDVIVIATDGLFDNLYEHEIASIVSKTLEAGFKPQDTAKFLAKRAQEVGPSSSLRSPFADAAQAAGYVGYAGGKLDDVVVIVSLVQKKSIL